MERKRCFPDNLLFAHRRLELARCNVHAVSVRANLTVIHVCPTRPEGPPRQTGWLPNIIPYTISLPLRAISGEVSLNAAQKTFALQGAHPKNMARGRIQNANLLLASIRDLHLKFPNRKVTRDGLTADHAGHPHAVTNITKMQPLTKRKTLNRPI